MKESLQTNQMPESPDHLSNTRPLTVLELIAQQPIWPEVTAENGDNDPDGPPDPEKTFRETGQITQPAKKGDPMDMNRDFTED